MLKILRNIVTNFLRFFWLKSNELLRNQTCVVTPVVTLLIC